MNVSLSTIVDRNTIVFFNGMQKQLLATMLIEKKAPAVPYAPAKVAVPFLFATGMLVIGFGVAAIGYSLGTISDAGIHRPPIYPADWMFWAIWFVLYPTMGVAGYHLWRHRDLRGSGLAWRLYLIAVIGNLCWVPVVHLSHSAVAAPAIMDALSGAVLIPALWAVTRSSRPASLWLTPLLIWGPITGLLKIWQLLINRGLFPGPAWRAVEWSIYVGLLSITLQVFFLFRGLRNRGVT